MTGFHNIRFPEDIAYGASGGPEYSTDIVITSSGHERRNINWAAARAVYNVAHGIKTQAQLETLIAFFRARRGRAYGFRFKDWSDFSATGQTIGTGNGETTQFQLITTYISGEGSEQRIITKPVDNSVHIYVDETEQESGVTINYNTGVVTFSSAPGEGVVISADFEFDVPVRFDTDRLSATLEDYRVFGWEGIPLVEVRG